MFPLQCQKHNSRVLVLKCSTQLSAPSYSLNTPRQVNSPSIFTSRWVWCKWPHPIQSFPVMTCSDSNACWLHDRFGRAAKFTLNTVRAAELCVSADGTVKSDEPCESSNIFHIMWGYRAAAVRPVEGVKTELSYDCEVRTCECELQVKWQKARPHMNIMTFI